MRAHGAQGCCCVVPAAMNCSHWRGIGLDDLWLFRRRVARCCSSHWQRSAGQSDSWSCEHLSTHHALLLACPPPTAFCGGPTHTGVQPLRCAARLDGGWRLVDVGCGVPASVVTTSVAIPNWEGSWFAVCPPSHTPNHNSFWLPLIHSCLRFPDAGKGVKTNQQANFHASSGFAGGSEERLLSVWHGQRHIRPPMEGVDGRAAGPA